MLKAGMFIGDRYEIIDKVGSGGMADVYKAKCHRLNRFVAIKVLKSEYSNDKGFVTKFRVEAQSVAGLSHPNIVNVYDVGEDNGTYYIVMELVEGITLKSYIEKKSRLEVKESVGIAIQIASGIEAAHNNHIIHRDIKPQNIIISRDGKVKVTDFGIAKAATSETVNSNAMGSVHYISPEQARGGYSDEKSDIYSLGITLYEMLTGKVPYEGDNTVSVALLHIQGEMAPLREVDPNIPLSLEKIVLKCTQKRPERRYLSTDELIDDLKRSLSAPDTDFVKISQPTVDTSPTIVLSDEDVKTIKKETKKTIEPIIQSDQYKKIDVIDTSKAYSRELPKEKEDNKDDDLETDMDPKLEKILVAGGIAIAIILAFVVIFLIGKTLGVFSFNNNQTTTEPTQITSETTQPTTSSSNTVSVPSVNGFTPSEAKEVLNKQNLGIQEQTEYNDLIEAGIIFDQSPIANTDVELNTTITVKVSMGPETFELPDVYGYPDTEAIASLREAKLEPFHEYENSETVEQGKVIRTSPEKGTQVKKNDTVTVYISSGKKIVDVSVPDLSNLTEQQARTKLTELNLVAGNVTTSYSDKFEAGLVMVQNYSVNAVVSEGTVIDFTVSLGKEPVQVITYEGSVVIFESPFDEYYTQGEISLILTKDGVEKEIHNAVMDEGDFPLKINSTNDAASEGEGIITMYLDGELCSGSWSIQFTKVVH